MEKKIERRGGVVLICQDVTSILSDHDAATAVRVVDRRGPELKELVREAPIIISNVRAPLTYERLLSTDGAVGAMMGGVAAASQVLGPNGHRRIMQAINRGYAAPEIAAPPAHKTQTVLTKKTALMPTIWALQFQLDQPIDFLAGQYAGILVKDWEWRDDSIAGVQGTQISFLVSTRTGGDGSDLANAIQPGEKTQMELPLGIHTLENNDKRKVFVATGTGLAPFLPMFLQLKNSGRNGTAELCFGCRTRAQDINSHAEDILPRSVTCLSREEAKARKFAGRVSQGISQLAFGTAATDFHLFGSTEMVAICRMVLQQASALYIYTEAY
ncbi:MAG TPA: FAD-dependent oxidoreductase [Burkholderiaceae bacterium]|nr:FAD-dependent oxidoreductase [Burkholderiaceae bacterium]